MEKEPPLQGLSADITGSSGDPEDCLEHVGHIDPAVTKRVLRKCDIHLIPILFLLFTCAFVDRYVLSSHVLLRLTGLVWQDQYRQCQNPRISRRPQDDRRRFQYCSVRVLHTLRSPGGSKQHNFEENASGGVARWNYVRMGYGRLLSYSYPVNPCFWGSLQFARE